MAGQVQKAYLEVKGGGKQITFAFNPTDMTIAKSSQWKSTPQRNHQKAPKQEFTGTNAKTLSMTLFFDAFENGDKDVSTAVDDLMDLTVATKDSWKGKTPQPPVVILHWGSHAYFECYVKSVSAKYTLFGADGTPLRATVTVQLEETPLDAHAQNPTSGGLPGRSTRTVLAGDSLHSVAYAEFGRPSLWRALAVTNGIDDPMRLRPGTQLVIPPLEQAELLA